MQQKVYNGFYIYINLVFTALFSISVIIIIIIIIIY